MANPYFDIGKAGIFNIVALLDAPTLLNILENGSGYSLTNEQCQQALEVIEQVQQQPQAFLLDITERFLLVPELEQFACTIQKFFMPN